MHLEILVEDSSGAALIEVLAPKILGAKNDPHSWNIHRYKGVGRIPEGLRPQSDPARRILLDQIPRLLRGLIKVPHIDMIVVIVDVDSRDCKEFLVALQQAAFKCGAQARTMFRLAIEEIEAWYLGDRAAILAAFPHAKAKALDGYKQDSICGTWEALADAIHPGGVKTVQQKSGPNAGDLKHEWANRIGPQMDPQRNRSPSFCKFRDGLQRIVSGRET